MKNNHNLRVSKQKEVVIPKQMPFLDAICQKRNQRINKENEKAVLGLYERNWILHNQIASLSTAEAGYLRRLAKRHNSWLANRV